ncbi:hypothetical protein [Kocuria aegyptia]|uniref:YokE-like PH domain-containing protein n=1 Tax=Kocuria aegyptia TaxID=330943 RepID=A0ABP4WR02_9MICC
MREDLKTARRALGVVQRLLLREHLQRVEQLLDPSETVQVLTPGWWRGHRSLVVVTTSRLLLLRRQLKCSSADHAAYSFRRIGQLSVHAAPPEGARFRITVGLDLEEFSVTGRAAELERALLTART